MKRKIPFILLAAAAACGISFAEPVFTTPVGYVTVPLNQGVYNLVGLTLHNPTIVSGTLTSVSSNLVVDDNADFSVIEQDVVYILEINTGLGAGIIQEIVNPPSSTSIATPDDLDGLVSSGSTYSLRKAATLDSIFGAENEVAELAESVDGSSAGADTILVPKGDGTFDTYFFVNAPGVFVGWFDGSDAAGDAVLNYSDAIFVRTSSSSTAIDLVISGEVKAVDTQGVLLTGFNLLSSVDPATMTLASSGLQDSLSPSADGSTTGADLVLVPNSAAPGTFNTFFYVDAPGVFTGWFDGSEPADDVSLNGGFFIRNFGSTKSYNLSAPAIGN